MATKKVFFRADSNSEIGFGHVMRSLALSQMLSGRFFRHFITRGLTPKLENIITATCDSVQEIPARLSLSQEADYLSSILTSNDIIVLDGYLFDTDYQKDIKLIGCRIVSIDDIHSFPFISDAVINHAGGVDKKVYTIGPGTELYIGPQYALVRNEFSSLSGNAQKEDAILICLGGADKHDYTRNVIETLVQKGVSKKLWIVIGDGYAYEKRLRELVAAAYPDSIIHRGIPVDALANLMRSAAMAICSPSTVAYEYLVSHGELYLVQTADNQSGIYQYLVENKLAFDLKDISRIDSQTISASILNQKIIFDGNSAQRLVRIFEGLAIEPSLSVRHAEERDAKLYFTWANDDEVRNNAFSKKKIIWEDHQKWFNQKLKDPQSRLFLISADGNPAGQVRFDFHSGKAYIDYSVAQSYRGRQLGLKILKLGIMELRKEQPDIKISGEVIESNLSSVKTFERLNFTLRSKIKKEGYSTLVYEQ